MYHFASLYDVTEYRTGIEKFLSSDNEKVLTIKPIIRNIDDGNEEPIFISLAHDLADEEDETLEGANSPFIQECIISAIINRARTRINEEMDSSTPIRELMEDLWISHSTVETMVDYYLRFNEKPVDDDEPLGMVIINIETEFTGIAFAYAVFFVINDKTLMLLYHRNDSIVIRGASTMYLKKNENGEDYIGTFIHLLSPATTIDPSIRPLLSYTMDDDSNKPIAQHIKTMYGLQTIDNHDVTRLYRTLKRLDLFNKDDIITTDEEELASIYLNDEIVLDLLDDTANDYEIDALDDDFIIEIEYMVDKFKQMGESFEMVPRLIVHSKEGIISSEMEDHIAYFLGIRNFVPNPDFVNTQVSVEFMYHALVDRFGRVTSLSDMDYLPVPDDEGCVLEAPFGAVEFSSRIPIWFYLVLIPLFLNTAKMPIGLLTESHYGPDGLLNNELETVVSVLEKLIAAEKYLS